MKSYGIGVIWGSVIPAYLEPCFRQIQVKTEVKEEEMEEVTVEAEEATPARESMIRLAQRL